MEVYEVIWDRAMDSDSILKTELFDSYVKAKEAFDKIVAHEKKYNDIMDSEGCQIEERTDYFDIWDEDDLYEKNHSVVYIIENKVK